ncbi:hypothetical protein CERSUDRAFT_114834 [Gelatoporia subvermispora B]|uniref:SPIN90/Ldb17 leucine-rich domain-containing protein n=1 Tax=Ceriporiopsis subvermispora (strain B) TaxID=914234 RepID=M2RER5_CERS8|nr:hypothetical protein CERSUDRAFT_114834 [Gelatoporia subvermispora B]
MPVPPMDVFGIVYIIETAQQFWAELDDILHIPNDITLDRLDATLRRFVSFCAAYHEQYLTSPLQLEHACDMLLNSELFAFHSERMSEHLFGDAQTNTDPHCQLIIYSVLLAYGRRKPSFLRAPKRWHQLIPLLMDHVRVDVDPDVDDGFGLAFGGGFGGAGSSGSGPRGLAAPIEAKLRTLSVRLLYEVCRVQKLSLQDLNIFDDTFIDYLFDLVEQTRDMHDDTFNYSVIKLIVALNEQFMVASLHPNTPATDGNVMEAQQESKRPTDENRVLRILMSRLSSSMTFGENLIFMLNRAERTPEDLCMQLLVLKLLYLLFTTKGMSEYFYTNDLCVLVDVFLREIGDIDEDNESLRHTYLRVLHPLLSKTQLRDMPYKRAQIVRVLESLVAHESIRDVDSTTKRLVARCLSGDWCVQFRKTTVKGAGRQDSGIAHVAPRGDSPPSDTASTASAPHPSDRLAAIRRNSKASRSVEHLNITVGATSSSADPGTKQRPVHARTLAPETFRAGSNDSVTSLPRVAEAATAERPGSTRRRGRAGSVDVEGTTAALGALSTSGRRVLDESATFTQEPGYGGSAAPSILVKSPFSPIGSPEDPPDSPLASFAAARAQSHAEQKPPIPASRSTGHRRLAPAPPPKRRKPPAIPAGRGDRSLTGIASSSSQPSLTTFTNGVRMA